MAKKLTKRPNGFKNTWGFSDNSGAIVSLSEQKKKAVEDAIAEVKASDKVVKAGKFVKNGKNAILELNLANSKEIVKIDATLIDETQAVEAEKARAQRAEQANANAVKALEKKMNSEKPVIINTAVSKAKTYTDAKVTAEEARAKSIEKANADAIVEEKNRAEGVETLLDKKIDDVNKEPTVVFDEIPDLVDASGEEIEEAIKTLIIDLGYDDASKGYINLYKSHNNMSEEEGSSYERVLDLYNEHKDIKGYVNIGGNNVKVEAMSIDEEHNWIRFYGHTGPMKGAEVPDGDVFSPLENYVEAVLIGPMYDENDKYLLDSFVLFRPLQGQAISAQFIGWSDEELEAAGIYGIQDARVIEPFFNEMGWVGRLFAAFFSYGDTYQAVKTDTAYYRLIEAFAEGRSFNAILPSIADVDEEYKDLLEQGIMLKPVTVTDTFATFSAEGALGRYELVLFNNTEEGGRRGTETRGFLMQYMPDHGTKRCEVRLDDMKGKYYVDDMIFNIINNVAGDSAPINTFKGIILNWEGKDYRFIKEDEEGRLSFGTYYSDEGKLIHEFFTTTGETIEIGENEYIEVSFEKISPNERLSEEAIYNAINAKDEVIAGLETRIAALEDIIKNLTKTEGDNVDNGPESNGGNV